MNMTVDDVASLATTDSRTSGNSKLMFFKLCTLQIPMDGMGFGFLFISKYQYELR